MIQYTKQMAHYDEVCKLFESANMAYDEVKIDGYKVTFKLTKNNKSIQSIVDFKSDDCLKQVEFIISSFEKVLSWG